MGESERSGALSGVACERDVPVKMRDGTILRCDVWRPDAGGKVPTLLQRQPYDKRVAQSYVYAHPAWYARQGYGVVIQDSRGRYASDGVFYPLRGDAEDGADSIAWCAGQPWCSGKVASFGFSLAGLNQLLAAAAHPKGLTAAIPGFYPQGMYDGFTHVGGAFGLAAVMDWAMILAPEAARRAGKPELLERVRAAAGVLGRWHPTIAAKDVPFLLEPGIMPFLKDYLDHSAFGPFWREFELGNHIPKISTPCLHISGWYDSFVTQTLDAYERFAEDKGTEHRLLVGPWFHIPWTQQVGAVDFGDEARNLVDEYQIAWLEAWLKDRRAALERLPRVRLFVTGSNAWHAAERWPLPGTQSETWYLRSAGRANSLSGNGWVGREAPGGDEPADYFFYHPEAPVQSVGGHSCCLPQNSPMGPMDQRSVELRNDVLIYTSEPLDRPVWVAGKVTARLFAATSARDTDWVVKLCDVGPSGLSINIQEGIIRARFRAGLDQERFIERDRIYEYDITVGTCCHRFERGHRIRVQVTSSNYPMVDRNPNTGAPIGQEGPYEWEPASQTLFHDAARASRLTLPVVQE